MENYIAVETKNVSKTFLGKEVLKNCNIHVKNGTIYGFLGQNGAGKSTLFKIITGLIIPTCGKVKVLGMDIDKQKNDILRDVGILIETPIFYEHLSAFENLNIHLSYMGKNTNEYNIETTLARVGLRNVNRQPVSTFSIGMRQRLAIARAIIHKPRLLILDEPINGLDPIGIRQIRELFLNLTRNHNMTILISSHILKEIEYIADTIGVIVDGTIKEEISMDKVREMYEEGLEDYFMDFMRGAVLNENLN